MTANLLIVESPAKAKTIKKYLGKTFTVLASYGHIRDLLPKSGAVDPDNDFEMKYQLIEKNAKHLDAIKKAMKKADNLYLATDLDREGEAISWHLHEILTDLKILKDKPAYRVVFNEITKNAIQEAVENPRELSYDLINAQLARRVLDYLVGFNLSPLLWKKIRRGLSAGRVQSPALRMIVERELEIEAFDPKEYWTVKADLAQKKESFSGKLTLFENEKIEQFSITDTEQAHHTVKILNDLANGKCLVSKVDKKKRKRNPAPPFITSTMQQEAARKLGFTAQRSMRTAQQLYEGIDIGDGAVGLITYMRTDSVSLAQEAVDEIRALISKKYGADKVPKTPKVYKTKSKNAQEAHEAIRPTSVNITPDSIKKHLNADQFKLYNLIWKRVVACQMIHATFNMVGIDLSIAKENIFRATGSTMEEPGFIAVYQEGKDDQKEAVDDHMLPKVEEGDEITLKEIIPEQHFTEPPPRFSEASIIKTLEEYGIGRPSTYASIIATLQQREYVEVDNKRFKPTDVGRIVVKFLTEHFSRYVDYGFTASLEDDLDAISRGEKKWIPLMHDFWTPFKSLVSDKDKSVKREDVTHEAMDENCPKCDKPLSIRLGRRGRFVGCTAFPDCDYTRNLGDDTDSEQEQETIKDRNCPKCEASLLIRHGRYGKFIGCTSYPDCNYIEPLEKPSDTSVSCPACKNGTILKRKSRRGKVFFSCSKYPDCDYAVWYPPIASECPECKWPMLTKKTTKKRGTEIVCPQKECKYAVPCEEASETE